MYVFPKAFGFSLAREDRLALGLGFGYRLCPLAAVVVKLLLPTLHHPPLSCSSLSSVCSLEIVSLCGRLGLWWVAHHLARGFSDETVWLGGSVMVS
ncbi:unnamed protein product [Prunus armeniaca]|uniref:Uncharacterized protein n=1 Tax=Prunus armeniaca TaxID=36596 RepID=A0A6J5UBL4_PRUAR|nr:unnamed protein product [Prunus armeniaca]